YMVPSLAPSLSNAQVVLLTPATIDAGKSGIATSLNEIYLRIIEEECMRSGLRFKALEFDMVDDSLVFTDIRRDRCPFPDSDDILGYLYLALAPVAGHDPVLRSLSHVSSPVAIFDFIGGWKMPSFLKKTNVKLFTAAISGHTGQKVARYLCNLGHCHAAYISPFHAAQWSRTRYESIAETFAAANPRNSVQSFTFDNPPLVYQYYKDPAHDYGNYDMLYESYKTWKKNAPVDYSRQVEPVFTHLVPVILFSRAELHRVLRELFENALAQEHITVWVCANDQVAIAALEYLNENEAPVPGRISVFGFDDIYESVRYGLTTYNFNIRSILHSMLAWIINPRTMPSSYKNRPVELEGMIMERLTVRRACAR
ncbi:MAG: hypothetical protein GF350_02060, partial [Chitinivibrionales bacterium]|nr:hypothetical protein [Chitinivibrionales bacterium]